jgi:hypothetical protein
MSMELWAEAEKAGVISIEELNACGMEIYGGNCPKCKKPWKQIKFENKFGSIEYYQPDCTCIMRCPICNKVMLAETLKAAPGCLDCQYNRSKNTWWLPECTQVTKIPKTFNGRELINKFDIIKCEGNLFFNPGGFYVCEICHKKYTTFNLGGSR